MVHLGLFSKIWGKRFACRLSSYSKKIRSVLKTLKSQQLTSSDPPSGSERSDPSGKETVQKVSDDPEHRTFDQSEQHSANQRTGSLRIRRVLPPEPSEMGRKHRKNTKGLVTENGGVVLKNNHATSKHHVIENGKTVHVIKPLNEYHQNGHQNGNSKGVKNGVYPMAPNGYGPSAYAHEIHRLNQV